MTTYNQCRRKMRRRQLNFIVSPALRASPQRRGRLARILTLSPRKPNSARRKAAKLNMTTGRDLIARVTGRGYVPARFAIVLVRGKGSKDTPNAKYTIIRGTMECTPIFNRQTKRSKYGVKKEN